jgi:hypothetical protein
MKYIYLTLIIGLCLHNTIQTKQPIFVIGCRQAGLFSNFLAALNNIVWAVSHDMIPVVYWDAKKCLYYDSAYTNTDNVWEYYFEPVSSAHYQKGDCIYRSYENPDKQCIPFLKNQSCYSDKIRSQWHAVIQRYIKIKPSIQHIINDFYNTYMKNKITIGIHLRGTDKKTEAEPVSIKKIIKIANALAKKLGHNCQFFIATDEQYLLNKAIRHLHSPVIYYDAYRSPNHYPIHLRNIPGKYKLGEDILIEAQLLSRCDYFIHTRSNVSIAVCMFNPKLPHIFIRN